MRVVLLGAYPPPHGGVESNIVAIQEHLLRSQHWCRVINLTRHRRADSVKVAYPRNALGVLMLLREWEYDIAHLHIGGSISNRLLLLGLVICLNPRVRAVLTLHSGGWPASERGSTTRRLSLAGFVFRQFDRIICVNEDILGFFRRLGVPESRLRLISPYSPQQAPQEDLYTARDDVEVAGVLKAFYEDHNPVLLTVGGLEPEYDLNQQIAAMEKVVARHKTAGLVIIGSGGLEQELRKQIAGQPFAASILLCGDVPHSWTLRAIAASDIFIRTTLYDGDAISIREALSAGIPVIATDNGMRPSGVALVPRSDSEALAEAILSRISSPIRRRTADVEHAVDGADLVVREYSELLAGPDDRALPIDHTG